MLGAASAPASTLAPSAGTGVTWERRRPLCPSGEYGPSSDVHEIHPWPSLHPWPSRPGGDGAFAVPPAAVTDRYSQICGSASMTSRAVQFWRSVGW